jgi:hypothetical protein
MGKFSNVGFLNVEWKTKDNSGEEKVYVFKPLPFANYPDLYELISLMSAKGLTNENSSQEDFVSKLDASLMSKLMEVEKVMVKNSYPDVSNEEIEEFVTGNVFGLIEPVFTFINRNK